MSAGAKPAILIMERGCVRSTSRSTAIGRELVVLGTWLRLVEDDTAALRVKMRIAGPKQRFPKERNIRVVTRGA